MEKARVPRGAHPMPSFSPDTAYIVSEEEEEVMFPATSITTPAPSTAGSNSYHHHHASGSNPSAMPPTTTTAPANMHVSNSHSTAPQFAYAPNTTSQGAPNFAYTTANIAGNPSPALSAREMLLRYEPLHLSAVGMAPSAVTVC